MIRSENNSVDFSRLRVAIVHYWLLGHAGGERVVEALAEMFPQADLFAAIADRKRMPPDLRSRHLTTSFLQKIPYCTRLYRHLLPLHPLALEALDLSRYDLILSSESGPAKGILSPASACHVCYCHTPMRYLWDMYHSYRSSLSLGTRTIFSLGAHYLRMWDLASAARVDYFAANSYNVAARIKKHYRRDATVIYPPVSLAYGYASEQIADYYLVVSRLMEYKRVDLAIEACSRLKRPLRIVGDGDQYKRLRKLAGPTVTFLGRLDDEDVRENYAHCRALLFPGEEDFGIVPVEAQSFGRPVIAYGRGGVLETVRGFTAGQGFDAETTTGVFFLAQTPAAMAEAMELFESVESRFSPVCIRQSVEKFDAPRFKSEMSEFIQQSLRNHHMAEPASNKFDRVVFS